MSSLSLSLRLFFAYIFSRRSESLVKVLSRITLFSSFLTVFSLILVLSIMNGFNQNMAQKLLAVEPHLAVLKSDITDLDLLKKQLPANTEVSFFEQQDLVLRTLDGMFSGAIARGMDSTEVTQLLKRLDASSQSNLVSQNIEIGPNEVLLGFDLARSLNVLEGDELSLVAPESLLLPPGEIIPIERVRIAQIVQSETANFDSKALIYLSSPGFARFKNNRTLESKVELFIENPYEVENVIEKLISSKALKEDANVQTWKSSNLPLFFALRIERWSMSALLSLSVLITSFSLVMVIILLINEKRKDIGILMATGLSQRRVVLLFTSMGFLLAGLGSLSGLGSGTFVAMMIEKYPISFMPDIYADSRLPALVSWSQVSIVGVWLLLLAFFSAWLPARQLASGNPSDNLRSTQKH